MAKNSYTAHCWVRTLRRIVSAAKNIEIQREYEQQLKAQFAAADEDGNGTLTIREFAGLMQQLNIDLSEGEILQIFNEVNTDRTEIEGEQVWATLVLCFFVDASTCFYAVTISILQFLVIHRSLTSRSSSSSITGCWTGRNCATYSDPARGATRDWP